MPGIPDSELDDPASVPSYNRCPLCWLLFLDPRECGACHGAFCRDCIEEALIVRATCPLCRVELSSAGLAPPHPHLVAAVDATRVTCPKTGCHWRGRLDRRSGHECAAERIAALEEQLQRQTVMMEEAAMQADAMVNDLREELQEQRRSACLQADEIRAQLEDAHRQLSAVTKESEELRAEFAKQYLEETPAAEVHEDGKLMRTELHETVHPPWESRDWAERVISMEEGPKPLEAAMPTEVSQEDQLEDGGPQLVGTQREPEEARLLAGAGAEQSSLLAADADISRARNAVHLASRMRSLSHALCSRLAPSRLCCCVTEPDCQRIVAECPRETVPILAVALHLGIIAMCLCIFSLGAMVCLKVLMSYCSGLAVHWYVSIVVSLMIIIVLSVAGAMLIPNQNRFEAEFALPLCLAVWNVLCGLGMLGIISDFESFYTMVGCMVFGMCVVLVFADFGTVAQFKVSFVALCIMVCVGFVYLCSEGAVILGNLMAPCSGLPPGRLRVVSMVLLLLMSISVTTYISILLAHILATLARGRRSESRLRELSGCFSIFSFVAMIGSVAASKHVAHRWGWTSLQGQALVWILGISFLACLHAFATYLSPAPDTPSRSQQGALGEPFLPN